MQRSAVAQVSLPQALGVVLRVTLDGSVAMYKTHGTPTIDSSRQGLQAAFFQDEAVLFSATGEELERTRYGTKVSEKWLKWIKEQGFIVKL